MPDAAKTVMGDKGDLDALVDRVTGRVRGPTVQEREEIRRGAVRDGLDRVIDRIVEEHRAVPAVLEDEVRSTLASAGFSMPVPPREPSRLATSARRIHVPQGLPPTMEADLRRVRAERARLAQELRPGVARPVFDEPIVTRMGVFYVPPDFVQAVGLGPVAEARLAAAGFRSAEAVLKAPLEDVAEAAGLSHEAARRAVADLDLTRVRGVDRQAADLLRLAGVHSVSELARRDAAVLARELALLADRHRFDRFPAVLDGEVALTRLVVAAREPMA